MALDDVFGPGNVLVSSTKSLIGHAMGAAGALEAVATIGALETSLLPPTANLWEPDPAIPFDCIPHTARPVALDCAMSNSFGFGGQNVSVIFPRPEMAANSMVWMPTSRAVITGIGCVSPFGVGGYALVAEVLKANVSAIQPLTSFPTAGLTSCLGAEIPAAFLPETEEARRWSRLSHMTVLACRQAVAEAGLSDAAVLSQTGLVVGSQYGDLRSTEAFCLGFLRKGPLGLSPLLFPSTVMNAMAGVTSIALGLKGPMLTLNQAGVAGELAVARALALLRAGRASVVIACGVDELFPLLYETLVRLQVPSPRGSGPEACRPFDQYHNGPVLGEGDWQWCLIT